MKKISIVLVLASILIASFAFSYVWQFKGYNVMFRDNVCVLEQDAEGNNVYGYKLGPDDFEVKYKPNRVLASSGNSHLFWVKTNGLSQVKTAMGWDEFRAVGYGMNMYIDYATRLALGISKGSVAEFKYICHGQWYKDGEWGSGDANDYIDAGSPEYVMFGPSRGIMGTDFVDIH